VLFKDPLKGKLGQGWSWLRENPKNWRVTEQGLEIRVEPGVAGTVKNALLRPAPKPSQAPYAVEVTIELLSALTQQYEQAGVTWYQGDKPAFKLVHELIDGKTYIIPGRKPTATRLMQLRLVVGADRFTFQYRPDGQGAFQTAGTKAQAPRADDRISIQCYNGPPAAEHWIRFSDFRIVKVAE
jgi:hypothetical protein